MDRYRMDEESSGSDVMLASAAAQIITNARSNGLPTSPSSSARMSRNSVAASRLLRSRKDRRYKSPSTLQPSGESDDQSIASLETIPTAARPRRVIHLTPIVTSPTSPITSPVSLYSDPTSTGSYATSPNSNPTSPNSGILSSSSSRPSVRSRRERVAGGAAAKLFGFQSHDEGDDKYENSHDSTLNDDPLQNLAETSQELDEVRQKTRNEFLTGLQENSRYRSGADTDRDETRTEVLSEASVPSILNRSEVFHENATAAILALLTPRSQGGFGDEKASFAGGTLGALYDIQVTTSKSGISFAHSPSVSGSAFCSPRNNDNGGHFNGISALVDTTRDSMPKSPKPLLSFIAERKIENIQGKMRDPNQQLADLLVAIATPELGQLMDRGYMVRRKNACGALKVLTANPANRKSICWTVGALPALTSVLADTGRAFIDVFTRREFVDARSRAVASLLNLCIPKENRLPIFHSDGLMQAIISVIDDDHGEARQGCTGILAYLAKTRENRLLMVQVPGLLDAVASVIKPIIFKSPVKKKKYHWDNNDDTSASLSSEEGHRNESMTSEGSDKFTVTNSMASSPRHTDDDDDDDYDDEADEDDDDDEDSDMTPTRATSPILPQLSKAEEYDKSPNTFLNGSRQNVFAFLFHMIKEKDNTVRFYITIVCIVNVVLTLTRKF